MKKLMTVLAVFWMSPSLFAADCLVSLEGEFALPDATVRSYLAKKGYDVAEAGQTAPCAIVSGGYSEADGDYKGMDLVDRTSSTYSRFSNLTRKVGPFFVHRQFAHIEAQFLGQVMPACEKLIAPACRSRSGGALQESVGSDVVISDNQPL